MCYLVRLSVSIPLVSFTVLYSIYHYAKWLELLHSPPPVPDLLIPPVFPRLRLQVLLWWLRAPLCTIEEA